MNIIHQYTKSKFGRGTEPNVSQAENYGHVMEGKKKEI